MNADAEKTERIAASLLAYFSRIREGQKRKLPHVAAEERSFWRLMARIAIEEYERPPGASPAAAQKD